MFIITEDNCQNCKLLKTILDNNNQAVEYIKASENMELCKELNIKTIPALVTDDKTVVFGIQEIATEVEKANG